MYMLETDDDLWYLVECVWREMDSPRFNKRKDAGTVAAYANKHDISNDYDSLAGAAKELDVYVVGS